LVSYYTFEALRLLPRQNGLRNLHKLHYYNLKFSIDRDPALQIMGRLITVPFGQKWWRESRFVAHPMGESVLLHRLLIVASEFVVSVHVE
jgi:hypothetical protein